uniref:Uncharacterized protein n=1 Tax=Meloidogyne hapla TaxID=6305 RepID=A0A1I8C000_MELHA
MTPQGGNSLKWIPLSLKKELEKIIPKITKSVLTTTTIPTTTTTSSPMLCSSGRDIIILSSKGYSLADITKRKRNVEEQERNVLEQNGMTENECKNN